MPDGKDLSNNDRQKIMHVSLPIGDDNILMGTDALESRGQQLNVENNFYITIEPESKDEADRLFTMLAAGGKVEMPMQDAFWGAYFGMFKDKFGIQWMVNYTQKPS